MIIVSQDKLKTNENLELEIFRNSETGKFHIENRDCTTLGIYKTEERAKEVLQEIIKSYRNYRTAECDGYTNVLQETAVFEMPED